MVLKTVIILLIANVDMIDLCYIAIPYRASTGPEQGFPCEKYYTGKTLFSLQGWVCSVLQPSTALLLPNHQKIRHSTKSLLED